MKKKIVSISCAIVLMVSMLLLTVCDTKAAAEDPILDGSYLTHEEESIGYTTPITRGEDYLTGYSKCVRLGPGKIYAGGHAPGCEYRVYGAAWFYDASDREYLSVCCGDCPRCA